MNGAAALRLCLAAGGVAAMLLAGGCETVPGESGMRAELVRVRADKGFVVASASPKRAVFGARGRAVVVVPPEDHCLDEESVAVSSRAGFALVTDCLDAHQRELANGAGDADGDQIVLPRVFPGILTVSVSDRPAYGPEPAALDAFEALLRSDEGLGLLGRGVQPEGVRIVATRRIGGALYVLIHEPADGATSILAPNFWRAFLGVNDRLVLVTVSSFIDNPMAEDAMMGFLAQQMVLLRRANRIGQDPEEESIAAAMTEHMPVMTASSSRSQVRRATGVADGAAPSRAPRPRDRIASTDASPGVQAPARAPLAPFRPG